jgi:hypothetical protein
MHQQPADPVQDTTIPPTIKKKHGCCFGCSMILLLLLTLVLGGIGYFVYQSWPKKSAVEKEYNQVPDYFQNR